MTLGHASEELASMSTTEGHLITAMATDGFAARFALTAYEAAHCADLPTATGRRDFRAGRLAAKRAAGHLRLPMGSALEVLSRADGSPRLTLVRDGGRRFLPSALSISHRDGRAVAVLAGPGARVGVDLERVGAIQTPSLRYFLTRPERCWAAACDPTVLWCLKEAAWKALGLGRSLPLKALQLAFDDQGRLHGVRVRGAFLPLHTRLTTPWPGFHAAIVWTYGGSA
jgi:4'-phosphopantetheinyl transferase EntD